jgi:hypothetical protein
MSNYKRTTAQVYPRTARDFGAFFCALFRTNGSITRLTLVASQGLGDEPPMDPGGGNPKAWLPLGPGCSPCC